MLTAEESIRLQVHVKKGILSQGQKPWHFDAFVNRTEPGSEIFDVYGIVIRQMNSATLSLRWEVDTSKLDVTSDISIVRAYVPAEDLFERMLAENIEYQIREWAKVVHTERTS